eukprot:4136905-Karenia_brevis.AAC.1
MYWLIVLTPTHSFASLRPLARTHERNKIEVDFLVCLPPRLLYPLTWRVNKKDSNIEPESQNQVQNKVVSFSSGKGPR